MRAIVKAIVLFAGFVSVSLAEGHADPAITIVVAANGTPPGTSISLSGSGFTASEPVDIYFDATNLQLALAGATGDFADILATVPVSAVSGEHLISAVGRTTGKGAQTKVLVSTAWPERGFEPRGKRNNFFENMLTPANVSVLDTLWSAATGNGIFSSPAVANGVVYVGSRDNNLYAFNATTGAKLWSAATGSGIHSSPAVANGVVYVGSDDNNLYAFSVNPQ